MSARLAGKQKGCQHVWQPFEEKSRSYRDFGVLSSWVVDAAGFD